MCIKKGLRGSPPFPAGPRTAPCERGETHRSVGRGGISSVQANGCHILGRCGQGWGGLNAKACCEAVGVWEWLGAYGRCGVSCCSAQDSQTRLPRSCGHTVYHLQQNMHVKRPHPAAPFPIPAKQACQKTILSFTSCPTHQTGMPNSHTQH